MEDAKKFLATLKVEAMALLSDGPGANPEYERGLCELIARVYQGLGMGGFTVELSRTIAKAIGADWPDTAKARPPQTNKLQWEKAEDNKCGGGRADRRFDGMYQDTAECDACNDATIREIDEAQAKVTTDRSKTLTKELHRVMEVMDQPHIAGPLYIEQGEDNTVVAEGIQDLDTAEIIRDALNQARGFESPEAIAGNKAITMDILKNAYWTQIADDVRLRINALRLVAKKIEKGELADKIAVDLILPNLTMLAQFCGNVEIGDEEDIDNA